MNIEELYIAAMCALSSTFSAKIYSSSADEPLGLGWRQYWWRHCGDFKVMGRTVPLVTIVPAMEGRGIEAISQCLG